MKFPRWAVPVLLRLLSLAGLTSAVTGEGGAQALAIGFALSSGSNPTSQPLSLDLDFFLQVADLEVKVPIMPLHLLGKKSWNVYNTSNIEIVRRDEAAAKAAEETEEQRLEELDAERRIRILRGEIPPPLAIEDVPAPGEKRAREQGGHDGGHRERKKRKRSGEDDTDFEMRIAHQQNAESSNDKQVILRRDTNAPITDHAGHISLFPAPQPSRKQIEKHPEAEKEAQRKKKEYEDQYTMRFDNAAGFSKRVEDAGWYSKSTPLTKALEDDEVHGKDVWGNEDPRRKDREAKRIVDSDPLAFMKRGAAKVREVERERKLWNEEKEREIRDLEDADRRRRRKRRYRDLEDDDLEGFSLDPDDTPARRHRHRERAEGSRERERERERSHRHEHSRRSGHRHKEIERERDEKRRHGHESQRRRD